MIDYQPLYQLLIELKASEWAAQIPKQIEQAFDLKSNGNTAEWVKVLGNLPEGMASEHSFNASHVQVGSADDLNAEMQTQLLAQLQAFHPWRKGPYKIFDIEIDTEWRSDWKWDRLEQHISPLNNRLVLDVGCGNGYHCWRMLGVGAKMVVGVDPLLLNVIQFQVLRKLYGEAPIYVLPIGLEKIPGAVKIFDTVFSMGVLYHRKSPIDHLLELKNCLRAGGELILETLVVDGEKGMALIPEGRYAKMRNVWFLPSCETLISWMERCGFINCQILDVSITSLEEQRSTEWMTFHSLQDFLDPNDISLTCEGLPAPKRAIILANIP